MGNSRTASTINMKGESKITFFFVLEDFFGSISRVVAIRAVRIYGGKFRKRVYFWSLFFAT